VAHPDVPGSSSLSLIGPFWRAAASTAACRGEIYVKKRHFVLLCLFVAALAVGAIAQSKPQTYKGVEVTVSGVERATNVSLTDCPAGANSVRGVIRPGDANEFAAVKVDFKVTPDFKSGTTLAKPVLLDDSGKSYNTAQSFAEIPAAQSFSCTFAFRIPKGTKLKRFSIDTLSIDLGTMGQ
jgi:hypothetical protein